MKIDTQKKLAGIMIPAFALRTEGELGIGDTKAVKEAIDFCARNSLGVLQLLPINETGGDNSPYNAISSLALDPVYIHMSTDTANLVPGLTDEHLSTIHKTTYDQVFSKSVIDYNQVKHVKSELLRKAFAELEEKGAEKYKQYQGEFQKFKDENSKWLEGYTIFRTILAYKNGDAQWTNWEQELETIGSAKNWLEQDEQKELKKLCRFYAFVQWVCHRQWTSVKKHADQHNVRLIGDIPFGISRYSADVWANTELFDLTWSGGAPPERFFQADKFTTNWGQNWGIPLYNWQAHEKQNYAWWRCRVEQVCKYFHGFRIDHVLGFFRIYAFPWTPDKNSLFTDLTPDEAKELTDGRLPHFVPRNDEDKASAMLNCSEGEARLKIILAAAKDAYVIAEDLGMVPKYVRPALKELGIPGFAIPLFERSEIDQSFTPKEELPPLSLATYGTHDNEPIASYYDNLVKWWHSDNGHSGWLEIQRLMRFLNLDENNPPQEFNEYLCRAFFKALLSSPCWLAVFMITDLLGSKQRFNLPGTSHASNWSERLEKPLFAYAQDDHYASKINYLHQLIKETNRQPYPFTQENQIKCCQPS